MSVHDLPAVVWVETEHVPAVLGILVAVTVGFLVAAFAHRDEPADASPVYVYLKSAGFAFLAAVILAISAYGGGDDQEHDRFPVPEQGDLPEGND